MIKLQFLSIILSLLLLVACGGGSSNDTATNGENTAPSSSSGATTKGGLLTIVNFNVEGTSADESKGTAPLNRGVNNGEFKITYEINMKKNTAPVYSLDMLRLKMYFSNDNKVSPDDVYFYDGICNGTNCVGTTKITSNCIINDRSERIYLECTDAFGTGGLGNIVPVLDEIPKKAYIILMAMDYPSRGNFTGGAAYASQPVVFH